MLRGIQGTTARILQLIELPEEHSFISFVADVEKLRRRDREITMICVTLAIGSTDPHSAFYLEKFPTELLGLIIQFFLRSERFSHHPMSPLITKDKKSVVPTLQSRIDTLKSYDFNVIRFLKETNTYSRLFENLNPFKTAKPSSFDELIEVLTEFYQSNRGYKKHARKQALDATIQNFMTHSPRRNEIALLQKHSLLNTKPVAKAPPPLEKPQAQIIKKIPFTRKNRR